MTVLIRRLSEEEASQAFPKRGQMDLSEYEDALRDAQPGDAFEITLNGLTVRALKRRIGQAVKHVHGAHASVKYRLVSSDDGQNVQFMLRVPPENESRRRGRPRRAAA